MVKALSLALLLAVAGCQTKARGSFCEVADPIRPSSETITAMTDAEVKDTLSLNEKGRALCGWKT
jgi:hypothetical protein